MNEFSNKLEGLIKDIHEIKIQAVSANSKTDLLGQRLNGTITNMDTHLADAKKRQESIDNITRILVVQIISFAFFMGGLVWAVNNTICDVKDLQASCRYFQERLIRIDAKFENTKGGANAGNIKSGMESSTSSVGDGRWHISE